MKMPQPRSDLQREPGGAAPTVLVVDDEELFARAVGKRLRSQGGVELASWSFGSWKRRGPGSPPAPPTSFCST